MLLVFDWDGTLADSTAKIVRCMQLAAEQCSETVLSDDAVRDIIGLGLPEAIFALYPDRPAAIREQLRQQYVHFFIEEDQTPTALFPGVADGLIRLHDDGHVLAVATGKSRRGLDRVLDNTGLSHLFAATRCADETLSKPHPQMLLELLDFFAVDAQAALMVGDTHFDMEMAQRANMPRIAVSYGAHAIERLQPFQPVACIDQFVDIFPVIQCFQES